MTTVWPPGVTDNAKLRVSELLGLGLTAEKVLEAQDWDLECCDPERVDAFLDLYERPPAAFDDDERVALMALIVASLDARLNRYEEATATEPTLCARLRQLLIRDIDLHGDTVVYWCCREEPDPQNGFAITVLMRAIAKDVRATETSQRNA